MTSRKNIVYKQLIETLKEEVGLQVKESSILISLDVLNMFTNIQVGKTLEILKKQIKMIWKRRRINKSNSRVFEAKLHQV